ncbi:MAG: hypothetical protein KAR47_17470 [Planctomycetes bacterium]|nr:hypothetical protein [Planctomycetota bacterium]
MTEKTELRKFVVTIAIALSLLGAIAAWRGRGYALWLFIFTAVFLSVGLLAPKTLGPVYVGWMAMAKMMGYVMTRVILTVLFYLVVTPVSITAKLFGKSFLDLKFDKNADSYWIERKSEPEKGDYEKQF